MTDMTKFFAALSERVCKENDLSDITYAMCESNPALKLMFLHFFFPESFPLHTRCTALPQIEKIEIARERKMGASRPDFYIHPARDYPYLVEVKIWDRSHHPEYREVLRSAIGDRSDAEIDRRIGYIAAYEKLENEDQLRGCQYQYRTWKDFRELLSCAIDDGWLANDEAILGYMQYLKNVCSIAVYKEQECFQLADLKAVFQLDTAFRTVIGSKVKENHDAFAFYTDSSRDIQPMHRFGRFFEIRNYVGNMSVWGWFGCYYALESLTPEIVVEFEDREGWGKLVCDTFGRPKSTDRNASVNYDEYDKRLYFWYAGENLNVGNPHDAMRMFFNLVLHKIKQPFDGKFDSRGFVPETYSAFHRIPWKIKESFFFSHERICVEANPTAWDHWPDSRAGVSFVVSIAEKNMKINGWTGATMRIKNRQGEWEEVEQVRFEIVLFDVSSDLKVILQKKEWQEYDSSELGEGTMHKILASGKFNPKDCQEAFQRTLVSLLPEKSL